MTAKKLATAAKINSTCYIIQRVSCHCYFLPVKGHVKINLEKWFLVFLLRQDASEMVLKKEGSPIYSFFNGQGKFKKYTRSYGRAELWLKSFLSSVYEEGRINSPSSQTTVH